MTKDFAVVVVPFYIDTNSIEHVSSSVPYKYPIQPIFEFDHLRRDVGLSL